MKTLLKSVKDLINKRKIRREKLLRMVYSFMENDFVHESVIYETVKVLETYENMSYSPMFEYDLEILWKNGYLEKTSDLSFDSCECCFHGTKGEEPAYKLTTSGIDKLNELTNNFGGINDRNKNV